MEDGDSTSRPFEDEEEQEYDDVARDRSKTLPTSRLLKGEMAINIQLIEALFQWLFRSLAKAGRLFNDPAKIAEVSNKTRAWMAAHTTQQQTHDFCFPNAVTRLGSCASEGTKLSHETRTFQSTMLTALCLDVC